MSNHIYLHDSQGILEHFNFSCLNTIHRYSKDFLQLFYCYPLLQHINMQFSHIVSSGHVFGGGNNSKKCDCGHEQAIGTILQRNESSLKVQEQMP